MGEDPLSIFVVGAPGLDTILNVELIEREEISKKYNLDSSKPILLVVQHPVTVEVKDADDQMRETLEAISELKFQTILIYPNADAGGRKMIDVIKEYEGFSFITTFKSIPRIEYLSIMKIANVIIGNSSSGIIESPSFDLPAINIGCRQQGRERAENVIDVQYNREQIISAIKKAVYDKDFRKQLRNCKNPYGNGNTGRKIADILSEIKITYNILQKHLSY